MAVAAGDILAICKLALTIGERLENGPRKVHELGREIILFRCALEPLEKRVEESDESRNDSQTLTEDQQSYLKNILSFASDCLETIEKFVEANGGSEEDSGIPKAWRMIKTAWNEDEIDKYQIQMIFYTFNIANLNTNDSTKKVDSFVELLNAQELIAALMSHIFKPHMVEPPPRAQPSPELAQSMKKERLGRELKSSGISENLPEEIQPVVNKVMARLQPKTRGILIFEQSPFPCKLTFMEGLCIMSHARADVGTIFRSLLERTIQNDMIEDYGEVVSKVTICSPFRNATTGDEMTALQNSLREHGGIELIPSEYELYDEVDYEKFSIAVLVKLNIEMMKYFKYKGLRTVQLEGYARLAIKGWEDWTKPLASSHHFSSVDMEEKLKYEKVEKEIGRCTEIFARRVLYCKRKS